MQPTLDVRHHPDGSIDFEFYRRTAARRRRALLAVTVKRAVSGCAGAIGAVRPVWRAGALAAMLCAVLATSAWSQSGHSHHTMVRAGEMKWTPGPASLPPGSQVIMLEGNPAKAEPLTMRLKFPAGYKIAPHTHPAIEHVTVLSGTFHMGAGESYDESRGAALPVGSFVIMPTGVAHFAWASEETVIQLHSVGPWGVTYINAADDPRKK